MLANFRYGDLFNLDVEIGSLVFLFLQSFVSLSLDISRHGPSYHNGRPAFLGDVESSGSVAHDSLRGEGSGF